MLYFIYAKRTDLDCFIEIETWDEHGALVGHRWARDVEILCDDARVFSKRDSNPFPAFTRAGVFIVASQIEVVEECTIDGSRMPARDA